MSRRHSAEKREINPDPKFGDLVVTKFMNAVMYDGKKSVAETIVYGAFDQSRPRPSRSRSRLPAGARQCRAARRSALAPRRRRHLPGAGRRRPERRQALAIRWLITAARNRNEHTMVDRLSGELLDAANNRGTAVKKREDTHKMAEANRAFAHYRW
jgi:small subunit ribosomal protein S7